MNFRNSLQYFLVKNLKISHQSAQAMIANGELAINGETCRENCYLGPYLHIVYGDQVLQDPGNYSYFLLHKPKGIECTLNPEVSNNLISLLPEPNLFYAGRLDKNSEGLVLLTNDGHVYNKIIDPNKKIEKTYEVMLEKPYTSAFLEEMESGVSILGTKTLPCQIEAIDALNFRIILTQGLNRQIRRMCFALGNYVLSLKRTKIGILELGPLELGKLRPLTKIEIDWLRNLPL